MKRIIYLALFISTLAVIIAAILYIIPDPNHLTWFKNSLEILLLIFSTWIILRLLNRFIWPGIRENFRIRISHLFVVILNILIVLALIFAITFGVMGLDTNTIVTASGLVTAGLAIALQGLISDVVASIIIDLDRLYKIGDWIKIDGSTEGKVTNVGWRHTELLSLQNTKIIINNGKMLSTPIQNFGQDQDNMWAIDEFQITLAHDIPAHRVKRVVETALQRYNQFSQYYAQVLARNLDITGVAYFVRYGLANQEQRWQARHNVIDALRKELHAYDLRISESAGEFGSFRGHQPLIEKEYSDYQKYLVQSDLFHSCSEEQIQEIINISVPILIEENTPIIHKGDMEKALYIIAEGTVEAQLTDQDTRLLHSGDYFGEQGLLLGNPRNADVIAKTGVLLYKYTKADLESIFKKHPEALSQMLQVMVTRSKELEEAIIQSKKTSKHETLEEIILKTVKEFFSI